MAESTEMLQGRVEAAVVPDFRERLLDKGLARGLIWRDGVLPPGSPPFTPNLTEDLLDYGHTVLAMALRLRDKGGDVSLLERAFLIAGEAIEAAVHRGDAGRFDRGFNRVTAAVAFHLARYAARAYSMLPSGGDGENLAPTERGLVQLFRRSLDDMHANVLDWLLDGEHSDGSIEQRLREDRDFDVPDGIHVILTSSFMRGLALFDHAILTGEESSALEAKRRLVDTAEAAGDMHAVSHWWMSTLASHLIDDLWRLSLHQQLPTLPLDNGAGGEWNSLRQRYIQRLRAASRSAIELWPSQLEAARRAVDPSDDLVVALPTSAGKTRIAEICILRALASGQRVVYVTPLRALSAQVERDLAETFLPLGFSVSTLYGSAGIMSGDAETLRERAIVVSTPEKLDFALRNDSTILDDVGLIILDEGHMFGPNEREVRYEAFVQRLFRRADADLRRIVCLSALFPTPEEMSDFVAWIRQDEPGMPVHSFWRPTRQRFGVVKWMGTAARLDVKVEGEASFVPRFIEAEAPPARSRRQREFPCKKGELSLAVAWKFISQGKDVLIYCSEKRSVEPLGMLALECIRHGVIQPLREKNQRIQDAMDTGIEWLGADHPVVRCLQYGIALHHGKLPRPFLNDVESLLRAGDCPLTIASPTLAQGLNLSASVLLVPSIWRNREVIPAESEFANVVGRAGRAFVDVEGLVLHIVWEENVGKRRKAVRLWEDILARAKAKTVVSGLLRLTILIFKRIAKAVNVKLDEVVEYVTGHGRAWDFDESIADRVAVTAMDWERDIASLDVAILALLDAEIGEANLEPELDEVLEGSLFSRQLARQEDRVQTLLRRFLTARTHYIWAQTSPPQRKGYHVAGVGFRAGQFLDDNIAKLVELLLRAEAAAIDENAAAATNAIVEFAYLVLQTAPFSAPRAMPNRWEDALRAWVNERPASEVVDIGGDVGVELLQDVVTYRLPWAMEAVRVHALAVGQENAELIGGFVAMAVESGSLRPAVITLLRSGLNSREAAIASVVTTGASFGDRHGMVSWLESKEIEQLSANPEWPTARSRHAWVQFLESKGKADGWKWTRDNQVVEVDWSNTAPNAGAHVVVVSDERPDKGGLVLTPDLIPLGVFKSPLRRQYRQIVSAQVGEKANTVEIEYFGSTRSDFEL